MIASSVTMPLEASLEHLFMHMDTHMQDFVADELTLRLVAAWALATTSGAQTIIPKSKNNYNTHTMS